MDEAKKIWYNPYSKTNVDIGLTTGGVTYLAHNQAEMESYQVWMSHAKANNLDSKILSTSGILDLIPNMQADYVGGIHTACNMRAEPWIAVPALSGIAARAGAILVENCAVRTLDMSAGRMAGVFTEAGLIKTPDTNPRSH